MLLFFIIAADAAIFHTLIDIEVAYYAMPCCHFLRRADVRHGAHPMPLPFISPHIDARSSRVLTFSSLRLYSAYARSVMTRGALAMLLPLICCASGAFRYAVGMLPLSLLLPVSCCWLLTMPARPLARQRVAGCCSVYVDDIHFFFFTPRAA